MQRNTSFNRNHDDSGLFSKVNEAITSFYTNIIAESVKRIEVIKENTKAILLIINEMHSTSRKDYFSYSFTENTIVKMVKIMQKSEKYFKKQIENFCYDLEILQLEKKNLEITAAKQEISKNVIYKNEFPEQNFTISQKKWLPFAQKKWVIIDSNGKITQLLGWITSQIEEGIEKNCKEIIIFKGQKITSIADMRNMRYYWADASGKKSGAGAQLTLLG